MNANLASLLYLLCGVLFILALRGLSSPVTSRRGNQMGMAGMAIAIAVTLATVWRAGDLDTVTVGLIGAGVVVGGGVGALIARRVAMTAMPQLVAAFHSLVGLAACLVAVAAIYTPKAYGIDQGAGVKLESLIELSIGLAIGAITPPMLPPTSTPAPIRPTVTVSNSSAFHKVARVTATAMAIPAMPIWLPRRLVTGLESPLSARMNSTPHAR